MGSMHDMLDDEIIRGHIKMYNKSTGISCSVIDSNGETQHYEGLPSLYCMKFKELTGDKCPCSGAHLYASRQSEKIGEPYVFFCPGGLTHWAAPIVMKGLFKGALVGGPVQMSLPDDYVIDEIIKANSFDVSSRSTLWAYLNTVPVCDTERVKYLSDMLYVVARDIMAEESRILTDRKRFYEEQAVINEEIQNIKTGGCLENISAYYSGELEKELLARVRNGDKKGARIILNELLGHVLFDSGTNLEVTKARALELMIMLSRSAVEGGGNLEMVFGLKLKYLKEIFELNTVEDLCEWLVKVLERFTDCIFNVESASNSYIVQKAAAYINENYMNNITLETISEYVYLSTSYFSRLFKREMGINFVDYLNKVRVEESKKYLSDLKISLSDAAQMAGFTDQSYFTKVFKRFEGISPGQFRKSFSK